ncbi:oligopeptide transporter, OPT family, partial [bacterium]|nr:oligopeptide transporter, OPT family [bacterium]
MLDKYGGGIGSDALPAPQAGLMAMLAKGIVGGDMAWPLVIVGVFFGLALLLIRAPAPMLIAVGMYLPFYSTAAIFVGGLAKVMTVRLRKRKNFTPQQATTSENKGILLASGLVAGEALMALVLTGIKAARPAAGNTLPSLDPGIPLVATGLGLAVFALLMVYMITTPLKGIGKS